MKKNVLKDILTGSLILAGILLIGSYFLTIILTG